MLCAGGTWIPVVANGAFRSDDSLSGAALVTAADAFFAGLARGFTVKVRDSGEDEDLRLACEEAGLEAFGDPVPEMICRAPLPDAAADRRRHGARGRRRGRRARLRRRERRGLRDLRHAARGPGRSLRRDVPAVLAGPGRVHRGGPPRRRARRHGDGLRERRGGQPAVGRHACPAARGAGLGALVTVAVDQPGLRTGRVVVLAPGLADGGLRLPRLGYETAYHYAEYVRWPKPPAR